MPLAPQPKSQIRALDMEKIQLREMLPFEVLMQARERRLVHSLKTIMEKLLLVGKKKNQ